MVSITYHSVADGKKIQTETGMQITPQTVKRERFGGITGTVTEVSAFPIAKVESRKRDDESLAFKSWRKSFKSSNYR